MSFKIQIQVAMNTAFDHYRQLYFDGGISSCYLWDTDSSTNISFAGVILLKKTGYETKGGTGIIDYNVTFCNRLRFMKSSILLTLNALLWHLIGCWDSIHVIDVRERPNGLSAYYKLISTCILSLKTQLNDGMINLGGSLTRQVRSSPSLHNWEGTPAFYGQTQ